MKTFKYVFLTCIVALVVLGVVGVQAQTPVSAWGTTPRGSSGWTILNTASTPAGNAAMGGDARPTGWMTIKGGFDPITPTTSQAFVISGTFEFVGGGGGAAYTWLRYALFYGEGALTGQNTPTAAWSETSNAWGYNFTPRSGAGTISNTYNTWPSGNQGTEWAIINSKSWTSTNTNGGGPFSTVLQAPYLQVATAGVYDWAISVQPLSSGGNEVRWYFVQQHAAGSINYYWWGGSFVDPTPVATKFNSIGFGVNNDVDATCKQVNLANVKVSLGAPITVPEPPFQSFYVDGWGSTVRGNAWPILNDSTYLVGDASMGSTGAPTAWATIMGGFREAVKPTTTKALVISGTFEFVGGGGGAAYTWLRYALFYQDSIVLANKNTKTAAWTGKNCWGYEFCPRSGAGTIANGTGGQGTEWYVINSAAWTSTYSNGGGAASTVLQAPSLQVAVAGVYDWAISVQPLSSGGSEVRWYFIQQHAAGSTNYYWWGGTFVDPTPVATKFNCIGFGVNNDLDATCKQVNIRNVKVDLATPITVPEAPWVAYYIGDWGFIGGNIAGWKFTPGDVIGNVTISGSAPPDGWAAVRGSFGNPVTPKTGKALIVTGKMEFVGGGFDTWSSLRYGVFYTESAGTLIKTPVDATCWSGTDNNHSGYLFLPRSGSYAPVNWQLIGKDGSWGAIVDGLWLSTYGKNNYVLGTNLQLPANAVAGAGTYDFAISVAPQGDGTSDVRFKLNKNDNSYVFQGRTIDNHSPLATVKFNGVNFALNAYKSTTAMKLTDVKVDLGASIPVGVEEAAGVEIPTVYALNQNYPNPFNPSTTVRYDIPKSSQVSVKIYDVLGRLVATLVDGVQSPNRYSIQWSPSALSSGVYFCRIEARSHDGSGEFTAVKKLLLMK